MEELSQHRMIVEGRRPNASRQFQYPIGPASLKDQNELDESLMSKPELVPLLNSARARKRMLRTRQRLQAGSYFTGHRRFKVMVLGMNYVAFATAVVPVSIVRIKSPLRWTLDETDGTNEAIAIMENDVPGSHFFHTAPMGRISATAIT